MATRKRTRKPLTAEQREAKRAYARQRIWTPAQLEAGRAGSRAYYAAHREEYKVKDALRRAAHREEKRLYDAAYYAEHVEEKRQYRATFYAEHAEKMREKSTAYRAMHPEEERARQAKRLRNNRDKDHARGKRYRARKQGAAINDFTADQWRAMQIACAHRCAYCGKRAKGHLTQDHLTPLSQGGNHTYTNILPACRSCNCRKNAGPVLAPVQPLLLLAAS